MDPAVIEAPAATPAAPAPAPTPTPTAVPAPGFLGESVTTPAATPAPDATPTPAIPEPSQPAPPAAAAATMPSAVSRILGAGYHDEEGNLKEGWSEDLAKRGFPRLANKGALAKTEDDFLKSLDHALQFVGKKAGHLPPTDKSTPEDIAEYRAQQGAPKEAKDYAFKPSGMPEGLEWKPEQSAEVEAILHKHHSTPALAKDVADYYGKMLNETQSTAKANFDAAMQADRDASRRLLQDEWGISYDTRLENTVDYMRVLFGDKMETDPIIKAALYKPEFIKLADMARRELRETLPGASGQMATSESPRQQIRKLMTDNPNWGNMPDMKARIDQLAALEAQQNSRRS